ncbi:tRNA dimethylallyltransferase [Emticicia oligotrophica DSM 17448]|uniref:tRNA dimethylallyltransferase n=1 Tax=Emticicia oligotrophica (strain DSM 17448 / CIP 109782 / MTCC 6937 / GPTSA100-15) TaxID=929562 RepID=A0ABN4AK60_EMTOG|nr:tRNA (adenosine(37)-N6)-dimethylallyltransferase MiaA [Emticicia oligotrophica]AFK02280.1 tRNA dimethylallyltransferase [Emticicia oligotrophica DSM 17448]
MSISKNLTESCIKSNLIIIVGPTAVGKTDLCVKLAQALDTEIISCDSRQFYKELSIGTAKPTLQEMAGVVHHFIDSHHINQYYSAGDFERDAIHLLQNDIFKRKKVAIMTGGSGLFVKAITDGLDEMPEAPLALREALMQRLENGELEKMADELRKLDPEYCVTADLQNSQRVVRALEVCLSTSRPFSSFHKKHPIERNFNIIKIGIERPREELYERINLRMDLMLKNGLMEEVKALIDYRHHNALQTVGYKEVFEYLDNQYDYQTMVELLKRNSRRYAKRQMTWFKNQDSFEWFSATNYAGVQEYIASKLQ